MKNNKKKLSKKDEVICISDCIINALMLENDILRKKQNNVKLTDKEYIFDTFMISPSFMIRYLKKGSKNE